MLMDYATWGIMSGMIGLMTALAGGIFGTYYSIRSARTMKQKSILIKMSIVIWMVFLLFIAVPVGFTLVGRLPDFVPVLSLLVVLCGVLPIIAKNEQGQFQG